MAPNQYSSTFKDNCMTSPAKGDKLFESETHESGAHTDWLNSVILGK